MLSPNLTALNKNEDDSFETERKQFGSVWAAIASDNPALEADRLRIVSEVDQADEIELIKGRAAIADEALAFSREIQERASVIEPSWNERTLGYFSAFVFSLEY